MIKIDEIYKDKFYTVIKGFWNVLLNPVSHGLDYNELENISSINEFTMLDLIIMLRDI